jgi:hypothetical protein
MQRIYLALFTSFFLILQSSPGTQQAPGASVTATQAATLLTQAAKALTGSAVVTDVTLTGTAEWFAGSDDETGNAIYRGIAGSYRLDMTFRNGTRSEMVSPVSGVPTGSWIGLDGTSNPIANHNLMADSGWFPIFTLGNGLSSANTVSTYVGQETRNGVPLLHISSSQVFPNLSGSAASLMQHLTQVDIYLDPSTLLPNVYVYNSHPDNNALLDIPTEIRYSDYQTISGTQIPLHVQKFVNGSLSLDLQFQNAVFNSGLATSLFVTQ